MVNAFYSPKSSEATLMVLFLNLGDVRPKPKVNDGQNDQNAPEKAVARVPMHNYAGGDLTHTYDVDLFLVDSFTNPLHYIRFPLSPSHLT